MLALDECSWLALETNIAGSQLDATNNFAPMEEQVSRRFSLKKMDSFISIKEEIIQIVTPDYRKSSNYSAKKINSNLRVALILERKKLR